ncbi:MAG: amidophosphoribosyltransferase [Lachnospiraceae bacterium]|nr:amidophosphoribosyltransferase [Lachnospiraceae bacterium]
MVECMLDDKLHEECGVFGIYDPDGGNVTKSVYYGLSALQHRGQESAGMAVCDTCGPIGNISSHKEMGLVSEVFHRDVLAKIKGNLGIGHVRYSTTGASCVDNAQPMVLNYLKGTLALCHNGNITNAESLRDQLQSEGALFRGTTDSEVVSYMLAKERISCDSIEEALHRTMRKIKGGYALLIMSPRKLMAVRDPLGIKPLCMGKRGNAYVFASESCALTSIGAEFIRDIRPGEIVTFDGSNLASDTEFCSDKHAHCVFEYIYFARLDSTIDNVGVYEARVKSGKLLAKRFPVEADLVCGVPDSGLAAAKGYAEESGIPFALAFHKNSYVGRTFIKPSQDEREEAVQMKLNVLSSVVKDKRIVLIDDSIVRGTTMENLVTMLRNAGAKEVHVRVSSPPFLYPCFYGTDVPTNSELIASSHTTEQIRAQIGADSLGYMEVDDLDSLIEGCMGENGEEHSLCKACFNNIYPV